MVHISHKIIFDEECMPEDIPYEYDDTIYGDISFMVNDSVYKHTETVLDSWMKGFVRAVLYLKDHSEYTIKESENYWDIIKFKREKTTVCISYLSDGVTIWEETVGLSDFRNEAVRTANEFIEQLCRRDERFVNSKVVLGLNELLSKTDLI